MKPDSYCPRCGRLMPRPRAGVRAGTPSKYCSKRCRQTPLDDTDGALEQAILALLAKRAQGATICPSEAARAVDPSHWASLMQRARRAARRLWLEGRVAVLQRGRAVEPSTAKGPIRLRLLEG
jgi:transposase-like protein